MTENTLRNQLSSFAVQSRGLGEALGFQDERVEPQSGDIYHDDVVRGGIDGV